MIASEREIRLATQLYEARDGAKTLLGDKYPAVMAELGQTLKTIAAHQNVSLIQAAQVACKHVTNPFTQIQLLAAAVELIEPSTGTHHERQPHA